jgi:ABC-type nitrate/sulfonate/bicarbonate transport system permease component
MATISENETATHPLAAQRPGLGRRMMRDRHRAYPAIAVVLIIAVWHVFVVITEVKPIFLPSPGAVLGSLRELVQGDLAHNALITIGRIYGGFALAAVFGIAIGLLMQISRGVRALSDAFIAAFYPLPKIALIPLLVIWLGAGEAYNLTISAVSAFFPIVVNTYLGVRLVDKGLIKTARDLGCSPAEVQRKVVLPGALPSILAGLHLGLGTSVVLVIAAEMVAGSNGLGHLLVYAGQLLQTERVFALLVVMTILGWAVTRLQQRLDRVIAPWAVSSDRQPS